MVFNPTYYKVQFYPLLFGPTTRERIWSSLSDFSVKNNMSLLPTPITIYFPSTLPPISFSPYSIPTI